MRALTDRWKTLTLLLCFLVLSLLLITMKARMAQPVAVLETWLVAAVMPFQQAIVAAWRSVENVWQGYVDLIGVRNENLRLRRQVAELQAQVHQYREAYFQQQRLRALLALRTEMWPRALAAEVVGIDPSPWAEAVIINRGSRHGVRKDLAVITPAGLVGRTVEVAPSHASVLLVTDRRSAVDALVQRTRARGIVVGKSPQRCELRYVDVNEDLRVGDAVISSGLGQVYPKGLLIGTVVAVRRTPYQLFHEVEIQPAVNLAKLEEVLVLVP
ncbi:MAG: cell shape-determining protein MreC [Candidatus Tectimicrobiota bacterium]|nr:MAG: cell shape-determining protein MreC [Candidatus Tectomicrobia bacterium]